MAEKNLKLLRETLEFIKKNPARHNQGAWVAATDDDTGDVVNELCETSMCFAGHAALLAGGTFDIKVYAVDFEWNVDEDGKHVVYDWDDDDQRHVSTWAQEQLGLSWEERSLLFDGGNSIEFLEKVVQNFENGLSYDGFRWFKKEEN